MFLQVCPPVPLMDAYALYEPVLLRMVVDYDFAMTTNRCTG